MNKAVVFWSGGKDSAMALYKARQISGLEIVGLVCTLNENAGATSVHGIPERVLDRQTKQTGLPLLKMWVPEMPSNQEYEAALLQVYADLKSDGISTVIYGDIFLEDIKTYRENLISKAGLAAVFPLWKVKTTKLMQEFISLGFKAIVCTIDTSRLDKSYLGRAIDQRFLEELPKGVDPAGENGEFHTFCFDGPIFSNAVMFDTGLKVLNKARIKQLSDNYEYLEIF